MAVTYHELVIKGNGKLIKGFGLGYAFGKSIKTGLIFCHDHPIQTHHLRDVLTFRGDHLHMITSARVRRGFLSAVRAVEDLETEVIADRPILRSYFEFEFDTVSREVASDIKRVIRALPPGLKILEYEPEESVDKDAKGVELYTPVHDYRFEAKGSVEGDVEKLLSYHKKLTSIEFIEAEDIVLET